MIIGICGKKRSGKDTFATILRNLLAQNRYKSCHVYSFAEPLRQAISLLFLMEEDQVYGDKKDEVDKRWNTSFRVLAQKIGTEFFQFGIHKLIKGLSFKRDFWVKRFQYLYNEKGWNYKYNHVLIPDVRFLHEAEAIRKVGGVLVRIKRNEKKLSFWERFRAHKSEKELDNYEYDVVFENDGTEEDLEKKVAEWLEKTNYLEKLHD